MIASKKDFAKGEIARFGAYDVTVNGVQDNFVPPVPVPQRSDFNDAWTYRSAYQAVVPDEGMKFIVVDLTVTNSGRDATDRIFETIPIYDFPILVGNVEYGARSSATTVEAASKVVLGSPVVVGSIASFSPLILNFPIPPDVSESGKRIYQIPAQSDGMKLVFSRDYDNPDTGGGTELRWTIAL